MTENKNKAFVLDVMNAQNLFVSNNTEDNKIFTRSNFIRFVYQIYCKLHGYIMRGEFYREINWKNISFEKNETTNIFNFDLCNLNNGFIFKNKKFEDVKEKFKHSPPTYLLKMLCNAEEEYEKIQLYLMYLNTIDLQAMINVLRFMHSENYVNLNYNTSPDRLKCLLLHKLINIRNPDEDYYLLYEEFTKIKDNVTSEERSEMQKLFKSLCLNCGTTEILCYHTDCLSCLGCCPLIPCKKCKDYSTWNDIVYDDSTCKHIVYKYYECEHKCWFKK